MYMLVCGRRASCSAGTFPCLMHGLDLTIALARSRFLQHHAVTMFWYTGELRAARLPTSGTLAALLIERATVLVLFVSKQATPACASGSRHVAAQVSVSLVCIVLEWYAYEWSRGFLVFFVL